MFFRNKKKNLLSTWINNWRFFILFFVAVFQASDSAVSTTSLPSPIPLRLALVPAYSPDLPPRLYLGSSHRRHSPRSPLDSQSLPRKHARGRLGRFHALCTHFQHVRTSRLLGTRTDGFLSRHLPKNSSAVPRAVQGHPDENRRESFPLCVNQTCFIW